MQCYPGASLAQTGVWKAILGVECYGDRPSNIGYLY